LEAEQRFVSHLSEAAPFLPESLRETSHLARSCCQGDGIESIWTWGWDELNVAQREVSDPTSLSSAAEACIDGTSPQALLKESMSLPLDPHIVQLREIIFLRTLSSLYQDISTPNLDRPSGLQETTVTGRLKTLARLFENYLPSSEVYRHAFDLERALPAPANPNAPQAGQASSRILKNIYLQWRDRSSSSREDATFAYATYLLDSGSVGEGTTLVNNLIATSSSREYREEMKRRWKRVLEGDPLNGEEDEMTMELDDTTEDQVASCTSDGEGASDTEFVVVS
jgi:hypothetical protein